MEPAQAPQQPATPPQTPAQPNPAPGGGAPAPNQPGQAPASGEDPGKTMGIIGLVLAFLLPLVGVIVSAIAMNKSKQAGHKNTLATVGLVLGIIFTLTSLLWLFLI